MVWFGLVWIFNFDLVWGAITIWFGLVWFSFSILIWFCQVQIVWLGFGLVKFVLIWFGMDLQF